MPSNYDNAAWFYDSLAGLVFGQTIKKAQVFFLQAIKPGSNVLIVGGGTGWILEEISHRHPAGLSIDYVELSKNMLIHARCRFTGLNDVSFIHSDIELLPDSRKYDAIITPFIFDSFGALTTKRVFNLLVSRLKDTGIWLYTDFRKPTERWQKALLKSMYLFFRIICRLEADELPDMMDLFENSTCILLDEKRFYADFIVSRLYLAQNCR